MSFDIIKHRTWWFVLSSVLVLASLISIFINGFNFGIDYTGGTILDMQFNKAVSVSEVRQVMDQSNMDLGNTVIQLTGVTDQDSSTDVMLRMRNLSSDETKAVSEKLSTSLAVPKSNGPNRSAPSSVQKLRKMPLPAWPWPSLP